MGVLGTAVSSEDVVLAVEAAFSGTPVRIAYLSALDHYDLLGRPIRTIQLASSKRIRRPSLSGRPLDVVLESQDRLNVGSVRTRIGPAISDLERSLLDAGRRLDIVGGIDVLAEALLRADLFRADVLAEYATALRADAALRRIGAVSSVVGRSDVASALERCAVGRSIVDVDPSASHRLEGEIDHRWRVRWNVEPSLLDGLRA